MYVGGASAGSVASLRSQPRLHNALSSIRLMWPCVCVLSLCLNAQGVISFSLKLYLSCLMTSCRPYPKISKNSSQTINVEALRFYEGKSGVNGHWMQNMFPHLGIKTKENQNKSGEFSWIELGSVEQLHF